MILDEAARVRAGFLPGPGRPRVRTAWSAKLPARDATEMAER